MGAEHLLMAQLLSVLCGLHLMIETGVETYSAGRVSQALGGRDICTLVGGFSRIYIVYVLWHFQNIFKVLDTGIPTIQVGETGSLPSKQTYNCSPG